MPKIQNIIKLAHKILQLIRNPIRINNLILKHTMQKRSHSIRKPLIILPILPSFYHLIHMMCTEHLHIKLWDPYLFYYAGGYI